MAGRTLMARPGRPRPPAGFAISASAIRLDPTVKKGEEALPPVSKEHEAAWRNYELVGEVDQIVSSSAGVLSQCRFYVGWLDEERRERRLRDDDGNPVEGFDPALVGAAEVSLDRFVDSAGTQRGLIRATAENFHVVGDCYMVGWYVDAGGKPVEEDDPLRRRERWEVVARTSIEERNDRYEIALRRDGVKIRLPRTAIAYRMWRRSPRYADESRAWVLANADTFLDLRIFTLAQRSAARSSIPADLKVVAAQAQPKTGPSAPAAAAPPPPSGAIVPPVPPGPNDPQGWANYIERLIGNAVLEVLNDAQSGRAVVGPVIAMDHQYVKDGIASISLHRNVDSGLQALVDQARNRIVQASDSSPEMLLGLGDTNRWNGAQIDDTEWRRYFRPLAMEIADNWTSQLLWPALEALNFRAEDFERIRILVDARGVVADPDLSKNSGEGLKLGAIGWKAWRRANGFSEEDEPTPEERAEIAAFLSSAKPAPTAPGQAGEAPDEPSEVQASAAPRGRSRGARPLGETLLRIEAEARLRIEEACEVALDQALARAGAKLRGWTRGDRDLAVVLAALAPAEIPARLGPARVAALAGERYEDDQQRREDMFLAALLAALAAARRTIGNTYGALLAAVNAHRASFGLAAVTIAAEEIAANTAAAEAVLRESLLDLADRTVFDPLVVPNVGEVTGLRVPAPVVRRTMAAAGGTPVGPGLDADPASAEGLIGGPTLGAVTPPRLAFEWVYGPGGRTAPFPEHLALDGAVGESPDDPVFSGSFLDPSGQWYPGDHGGCQCAFEPVYGDPDE